MQGIPPAKDSDAEDVVWGLQTAASLWKRGEHIDALIWLRRSAQAAGDANDDDRALELARVAAELSDWMAAGGPQAEVPPVEVEVPPVAAEPVTNDGATLRPSPPLSRPPSSPTIQTPEPVFSEPEEDRGSVLPADKVHAGMFNPWDEAARPAPEPIPPVAVPPSFVGTADEEVITSVRPNALEAPRAEAPPPPEPLAPSKAPPKPPTPPRAPPPLPPRARTGKHAPAPPAAPAPRPAPPPAAPPAPPAVAPLVLDDVEAFADLPDDAREAFAEAATRTELARGEEVGHFALAYVVSGTFDVAATVVDAPAASLTAGSVLRARGTTDEGVPMRLICSTEQGLVATWSDAAVDDAFRTCPWVEEDLRVAADRVQTLVGITIGPLGERLDPSIREEIVGRLTMRSLEPGEVVVNAGEPVPGLILVGVGELELVSGEDLKGSVGSGEFLFPGEVLGAGASPSTARAGAGGALVLFGDRQIAQELLVTCPPLLEVFAGM